MTTMPANPTPAEGVVVPIYPTEAMLDAAHGVPRLGDDAFRIDDDCAVILESLGLHSRHRDDARIRGEVASLVDQARRAD